MHDGESDFWTQLLYEAMHRKTWFSESTDYKLFGDTAWLAASGQNPTNFNNGRDNMIEPLLFSIHSCCWVTVYS